MSNRLTRRVVRYQRAALQRVYGFDSWHVGHAGEPYVRDIASGGRQIQSIEVHERTIRIFGDVAIVTGEALQRGYRRGELRAGRLRFTHVWIRQSTTWRMLLSQSTEIKSTD